MSQFQKELGIRMTQMEGQLKDMRGDIAEIKGLLTSMMRRLGLEIRQTSPTAAGAKKKQEDELQPRKNEQLHNLGGSWHGAESRKKRAKVTDKSTANKETVVETGEVSARAISTGHVKSCPHQDTAGNFCYQCDIAKQIESRKVYLHDIDREKLEDFNLTESEIKLYYRGFLKDKKLILILDLEYTLLNSITIDQLTSDEQYLLKKLESKDDMNHTLFKLDRHNMLIKLRPFVHTFLEKASAMYEMYIYTTGDVSFAKECAHLLDPQDAYFPSKVLSIEGLKGLVGAETRGIVLDDSIEAWEDHKERVIQMKRYYFFASGARQCNTEAKSLSELKEDERKSDGILPIFHNVLRRAHELFFNPWSVYLSCTDITTGSEVRKILGFLRKQILKDCHIAYYSAVDLNIVLLRDMGARDSRWTPNDRWLSGVTHVVTSIPNTEVLKWAEQNNKFVVTPQWIEKAHYLWKRPKEEDFPVLDKNDQ